MTSTRAPVPPVDLKARIAAFQEQQKANAKQSTSSTSATLPKPPAASGNTNLRDRIASFEKQGAVPVPKSRFGFAPIPQQDESAPLKRHGELYGNRIPGLSRPHIPVPPNTKGNKRETSRSRNSTRSELERYTTSPSPPGSPFLPPADHGESIGDVLSDGDPTSADDPSGMSLEAAQTEAAGLVSPPSDAPVTEESHSDQAPSAEPATSQQATEPSQEAGSLTATEQADVVPPAHNEQAEPPTVVVSPSEPVAAEPVSGVGTSDVPADEVTVETTQENKEEPPTESELKHDPPVDAASENSSANQGAAAVPEQIHISKPPADDSLMLDPAVQAVIAQLDRATQSGDAGVVSVPVETLETLATLDKEQQKSVADMLDQLLLQQDMLDIATPVKQRFSLNGQLSSQAVLDYIAQQSALPKDASPTTPQKDNASKAQSNQFLSPTTPSVYSSDSPIGEEPLSPASDIYSAYATTPAEPEKYRRALPAIPEAPDSPSAFKTTRRGTFGPESDVLSAGSSAPTSAPLRTPSDDGMFPQQQTTKQDTQASVAPSDGMVRITGTPPRVLSPPLSVVIPQQTAPQPAQLPAKKVEETAPLEAVGVSEARRRGSVTNSRSTLAPASQAASGSSSSSPASTYSPGSAYSGDGTSPSSTGGVSRKPSRSSARSRVVSPAPLSITPYEEPELTPIEGPKGFRAVVHGKVVEGKSRPVSINVQTTDLPSPSPMNATGMSDLAALLADAVVFEKQLADIRTPSKKPRAASHSTASPPPALSRAPSDRPRPVQDLPESPEDHESFARMSQDRGAPRTSRSSGRPLPAQPRPTRPSTERTIERKSSRPSLDRMPSRPSVDNSTTTRPSTDSTSSRPQLQPMFLTADPNAVRIPLPPRPKSAMAHSSASIRSDNSTPPPPPPPKSPPRTGYLTNLLSRAKSSGSLRPTADSRDSMGSSSEDSVMVATPPTPPYDPSVSEISLRRSSTMFKNSLSRASNFADKLLHRKDASHQGSDAGIAYGDDEDGQSGSSRTLPRPPRPLPLPPQPQPPHGLPPPVPGNSLPNANTLAPVPSQGQPQLSRRSSWKSIASVSTTGITEALDTAGIYDSFPTVPESVPQSHPHARPGVGLPSGPAAYTSPRPAPLPPLPPPNQPLPPPPSHPLPAPPRGASHGAAMHIAPPGGRPGLPASPASRPKTLPSRPKVPPQQLRTGMI